jgi:hypothetical protein
MVVGVRGDARFQHLMIVHGESAYQRLTGSGTF